MESDFVTTWPGTIAGPCLLDRSSIDWREIKGASRVPPDHRKAYRRPQCPGRGQLRPGYLRAIEETFGWNGVDYAMLVKKYAGSFGQGYSPPRCIGAEKSWVMGSPVFEDVSTSYVERSNLTMR